MLIKQLSVFLENKTGRLFSAANVLSQNKINISALSLADTTDFGVLRLIVDSPEKAREVLQNSGIVVRVTDVVAVAVDDAPGGAAKILKLLSEYGLSVEYMYACVGKVSGKALMIFKTNNNEITEEILSKSGFANIDPAEIYRI